MTFTEHDLKKNSGFSSKYYEGVLKTHMEEISEYDYRLVGTSEAKFYAVVYAKLRLTDILQKQDLVRKSSEKELLINEHDRWQKALLQAQNGKYSKLIDEMDNDAVVLVKQQQDVDLAYPLFELCNILRSS